MVAPTQVVSQSDTQNDDRRNNVDIAIRTGSAVFAARDYELLAFTAIQGHVVFPGPFEYATEIVWNGVI